MHLLLLLLLLEEKHQLADEHVAMSTGECCTPTHTVCTCWAPYWHEHTRLHSIQNPIRPMYTRCKILRIVSKGHWGIAERNPRPKRCLCLYGRKYIMVYIIYLKQRRRCVSQICFVCVSPLLVSASLYRRSFLFFGLASFAARRRMRLLAWQ